MKTYSTTLLFLIMFTSTLFSQVTIGSGALSYARQSALSNNKSGYLNENRQTFFPNEKSIITEDFFNYHKHQITIPSNEDVALTIDYDRTIFGKESNEILLQLGIATQPAFLRTKDKKQVNISLVIDVSGSMDGMKLNLVKKALRKFVSSLSESDKLSIITFSTDAKVVFPSQEIAENKVKINQIIDNLEADGMTNLNAGMMLGYNEVSKNHHNLINSRVILMTDGETNTGVTNLSDIIENSLKYNKEGIEISTIGIGTSLDFDLLRELADKGKGSNYYIGEHDEDIYKVFEQELDGILYRVGDNQKVEIDLPSSWEIVQNYGYETKSKQIKKNCIVFNLENLSASSTRIILLRVKMGKGSLENDLIKTVLTFRSQGKPKSIKKELAYSTEHKSNDELKKNYHIALMAQSIKEACKANEQGQSYKTQSIIEDTIKMMKESSFYNDEDFQRVYKILLEYSPRK